MSRFLAFMLIWMAAGCSVATAEPMFYDHMQIEQPDEVEHIAEGVNVAPVQVYVSTVSACAECAVVNFVMSYGGDGATGDGCATEDSDDGTCVNGGSDVRVAYEMSDGRDLDRRLMYDTAQSPQRLFGSGVDLLVESMPSVTHVEPWRVYDSDPGSHVG